MEYSRTIITLFILISTVATAHSSERAKEILTTILEHREAPPNESVKKNSTNEKEESVSQRDTMKTEEATKKERSIEKPAAIPSPDMILFKTAIALYNSSLYEASLKKFTDLRTDYPQSPLQDIATIWAGKVNLSLRKPDAAITEFNQIKEDSGEYPAALYYLGESQLMKGASIQAIEYYYKLSSQFPEYELADKALIKLSRTYLSVGKGDQSLDAAIKIVKYYPDRDTIDDAYYFIGKVFEKDPVLKDIEVARKIYRIFLEKAKDANNIHFWNSPLKRRVQKDLKYLEATFFNMEK